MRLFPTHPSRRQGRRERTVLRRPEDLQHRHGAVPGGFARSGGRRDRLHPGLLRRGGQDRSPRPGGCALQRRRALQRGGDLPGLHGVPAGNEPLRASRDLKGGADAVHRRGLRSGHRQLPGPLLVAALPWRNGPPAGVTNAGALSGPADIAWISRNINTGLQTVQVRTVPVEPGGRPRVSLPFPVELGTGTVLHTVTFTDGDPGDDTATSRTTVLP